jgi:hypothetical protein
MALAAMIASASEAAVNVPLNTAYPSWGEAARRTSGGAGEGINKGPSPHKKASSPLASPGLRPPSPSGRGEGEAYLDTAGDTLPIIEFGSRNAEFVPERGTVPSYEFDRERDGRRNSFFHTPHSELRIKFTPHSALVVGTRRRGSKTKSGVDVLNRTSANARAIHLSHLC